MPESIAVESSSPVIFSYLRRSSENIQDHLSLEKQTGHVQLCIEGCLIILPQCRHVLDWTPHSGQYIFAPHFGQLCDWLSFGSVDAMLFASPQKMNLKYPVSVIVPSSSVIRSHCRLTVCKSSLDGVDQIPNPFAFRTKGIRDEKTSTCITGLLIIISALLFAEWTFQKITPKNSPAGKTSFSLGKTTGSTGNTFCDSGNTWKSWG